jgi:hypothetical protein
MGRCTVTWRDDDDNDNNNNNNRKITAAKQY